MRTVPAGAVVNRTTIDAYAGSARDLLALLRRLHNGEGTLSGMSRLQALDAVCDKLASMRARGQS